MKKLVIAAAVLGAFAGTAQAQSSVTLFGVVDTNVVHLNGINNGNGGTTSKTFEDNSGINSSRIGFRGTEDLGGGLKAGFWLEAGINTNNGTGVATSTNNQSNGGAIAGLGGGQGLTFNRRATVSLIGDSWGEVRIGRDYTPTFWNAANVDPMGYNGIAEIASLLFESQGAMGPLAVRASNGISYLTPNTLGGIFVQATYAMGNNANNQSSPNGTTPGACGAAPAPCFNIGDNGNYYGINGGYQSGPLYAGLATSETKFAQTASTGNIHTTNLGVSYNFGVVKPDFFWQTSKIDASSATSTDFRTDVWSVGASVPLGQGEFRANFARANGHDQFAGNSANMFGLAYVYNLSKRTALYAQYARVSNHGDDFDFSLNAYSAPRIGDSESGVALGVRTSF